MKGERLSGHLLQRRNRAVFERDDWTCQECGLRAGGVPTALVVDHRVPFAVTRSDPLVPTSNLATLCIPCHKAKNHRERTAKAYRTRYRANGLPR